MKKILLLTLFLPAIYVSLFSRVFAQIHIIPDVLTSGIDYTYIQGNPYFGYVGEPTAYNNKLYFAYQPILIDGAFAGNEPIQIAQYDGTDVLKLVANPDGGLGFVYNVAPLVYNNKLYIDYKTANKVSRLGQYDGTTLTLIPNPDASVSGYQSDPIIYNNKLYIKYSNSTAVNHLAQFDGSQLSLIPNPDASVYGYQGNPIVFNNKLYIKYSNNVNGAWELAEYDGTNLKLIPNPDGSRSGYQGHPILFNNKLYMMYDNASGKNQLMVYDGAASPTLIANPDAGNGFVGLPIVYNNNLYIQYQNASGVYQLAKYNGTSISLVPNPDATSYGYWNTPIIYNGKLCIFYKNASRIHQLALYDGTSLKLVPNPDASNNGYWDQPIVYDGNLYFQYYDASNILQLAYYDGTSIKIIHVASKFYGGSPLLFNNNLFLQIVGSNGYPYPNIANLAYLNQSTLPVSLLNFSAEGKSNEVLLSWQTATEDNNKGFEVYRSSDGSNFSQVGFVAGAVNSSVLLNYSFEDHTNLYGKIYYRLRQVDEDNNGKYSQVISINTGEIEKISFSPNPVQDAITVHTSKMIKEIKLLNSAGSIIKQWNNVLPNDLLELPNISKGMYFLQFKNGDLLQTQKLIKE